LNWHHFDKNEYRYLALYWVLFALIKTWVNTESVFADFNRLNIAIDYWKPLVWEGSSHFVSLLLIILIVIFDKKLLARYPATKNRIIGHLILSLIYSLSHVIGMVLIRKAIYWGANEQYDFGNWSSELIYEYRKDLISYLSILATIYAYRFIISRLRGEAKVIATGEDSPEPNKPERLLVKKIDKEFIIKINDIDWIEAAGNYMNLNINGKIYPLRETMSGLESKLNPNLFARIHRSTIVNLDRIKQISALETGDYEINLNCGKQLRLSRRYREKVKQILF